MLCAQHRRRPRRHLQRRRRRRHLALPGDPPRRPPVGAAAAAAPSPWIGQALRRLGLADFCPEQIRFLSFGRGRRHHPDARRCSASSPRYTTARGVRRLRGPAGPARPVVPGRRRRRRGPDRVGAGCRGERGELGCLTLGSSRSAGTTDAAGARPRPTPWRPARRAPRASGPAASGCPRCWSGATADDDPARIAAATDAGETASEQGHGRAGAPETAQAVAGAVDRDAEAHGRGRPGRRPHRRPPGRRAHRLTAPDVPASRRCEVSADRVGAQGRRSAGVPAPPAHRRLRGRRVRLRPRAHRAGPARRRPPARTSTGSGSRPAGSRTSRPRAAHWSSRTTPAPSRSTRLMTQIALLDHHPAHRHLRLLGADLVFQTPFVERARPQERRHAGLQRRRRAAARRVASWSGSGPRASRASASRSPSATSCSASAGAASSSAALRTGVPIVPCSIVGAEEIYPMLGNVKTLARLLGVPYLPITPTFPWLGPLGAGPAAEQVDHRVRRADPHRRVRPGRGRRPDAGLQPHRPGARDDPAHPLPAADVPPLDLLLARRAFRRGRSRWVSRW